MGNAFGRKKDDKKEKDNVKDGDNVVKKKISKDVVFSKVNLVFGVYKTIRLFDYYFIDY